MKSRARKAGQFPTPEGVAEAQWQAFCQQRRKPLTDHGYRLLCKKLGGLVGEGHNASELIDSAVERGWETVFPPAPRQRRTGGKPSGWAPKPGMQGKEPFCLDDDEELARRPRTIDEIVAGHLRMEQFYRERGREVEADREAASAAALQTQQKEAA